MQVLAKHMHIPVIYACTLKCQKQGGRRAHTFFDAGALACDKHITNNMHLCPDFAALANDKAFKCGPIVQTLLLSGSVLALGYC